MNNKMSNKVLIARVEHIVNFNEVDMMGVVWHGHYLRFFEMAREAFARQYGIDVTHLIEDELRTPIVKVEIKYKAPAHYGETLIVEARYKIEKVPKFVLNFKIFSKDSSKLLATGTTTQIFTTPQGEVFYTPPPLLEKFWRKYEENNE